MEEKIVVLEEVEKPDLWLSPLELRIIDAASYGKTSKEIAGEMGLAWKTVELYRHIVMKRLKCHNMPHLIGTLFREKLLS